MCYVVIVVTQALLTNVNENEIGCYHEQKGFHFAGKILQGSV
jgi:hypothetical protein